MTALVASWTLMLLTVLAVSFGHQVIGHAHETRATDAADDLAAVARSGVALGRSYLDRWVTRDTGSALTDLLATDREPAPLSAVDLSWTNDPRLRRIPVGRGFVSIGYVDEGPRGARTVHGLQDENRRVPITLIDRETARSIPGLSPEAVEAIAAWNADPETYRDFALESWPGLDPRSRATLARLVTTTARTVNVNTASAEVLTLLGIPAAGARKIVARRHGPDGVPGTADDRPFTTLDDPEGGLRECALDAIESAAVSFLVGRGTLTTTSDVFRIRSRGWFDENGPWCEIEAILDHSDDAWEVRSWTLKRSA